MSHVVIIAEAGVNHNGNMALAKRLVDVAADAGADYVKFQSFNADLLLLKSAEKAGYQKKITGDEETQHEMLKKLELSVTDHHELISYCAAKGIKFLSSPFDLESIEMLVELNLDYLKVPSGEITNYPYLQKIGASGKEILLSTGMSKLGEIEEALDLLIASGASRDQISVLHCNTEYPTPPIDANIRAITTITEAFNVKAGYSDHTLGMEASVAAVALGATIIEKHITLDKQMDGPDHLASMEPKEFKQFVRCVRNVQIMLGNGLKNPSPSELKNLVVARKSIVAKEIIKKGETISEDKITTKRPGDGISPMRWSYVIGRVALRDYGIDDQIDY